MQISQAETTAVAAPVKKSAQQIVYEFVARGYPHMQNIPGNRVFYTDNTASTLAWVEHNVVIEYYMLFPNMDTPLHSHPFKNQVIFISGDLLAYRKDPAKETPDARQFTDADVNYIGSVLPAGYEHGFKVGPKGAIIYNIQIWDDRVKIPLSAAVEYIGDGMGPIHEAMRKK